MPPPTKTTARITFDVSLSPESDLPITATYATGNGTGTGGAFAGTDFTAPTAGSNTVRFSPGEITAQISHRPDRRQRQRVDRGPSPSP